MRPQRGHISISFDDETPTYTRDGRPRRYSCSHVSDTEKFDINKKDNVHDAVVILEWSYKKMPMLRP